MLLILIILIVEVLTLTALSQRYYQKASLKYAGLIVCHMILSMWLWFLLFRTTFNRGFYDNPQHMWLMLNLNGMLLAVVLPRFIFILLHFSGRLIRIRKGGFIRWMTDTGAIIMAFALLSGAWFTLHGRFNFKTEEVTVKIKGLQRDLDGLRIVQISDLHLTGFYHRRDLLEAIVDKEREYKPDILINTGDFVTFGWREFAGYDTIFSKADGKYGKFAIMGNHDSGIYHPYYTEADRENNLLILNNRVSASGYRVLNDAHEFLRIGNARLAIIGVTTGGRFPRFTYGNLDKAVAGTDSADFKILLSHDPNHYTRDVAGKYDIGLTLSGHTHGMQIGIMTKWFRWSPAKYIYTHWNGLYANGNQFHYVNRGLGTLGFPMRIWMPPEITVLTLKAE